MQDEEIICIALLKVKLLDQLSPPDIRILAQFFNIPEKGMYQQTLMVLKKSIAYIILIERYDLQEYLCLSKFKRLPNHLHHLLLMYFRTVRECFQEQKRSIQEENYRSLQKTQTGMEKLSSWMRNAVPKVPPPLEKPQVGFNRYNFFNQYSENVPQSRMNYPVPSIPSYLFPYQNYVNNNMFQDYANRNNVVSNVMLDRSKEQEASIPLPKKAEMQLKNDTQSFKQEYLSESNIQSEEAQVPTPSKYQCFCGKKREDDIVKCKQCSKEFHSKCWIPLSPQDAVCPFCKLIYKHCYTKLVGQQIIERSEQVGQKLSNVKKLALNSAQVQRLNQAIKICQTSELFWIQLRMLRIQPSSQGQPKGLKSCFTLALSEAKKLSKRKWLQLKLTNIGDGGYLLVSLACVTPKQFQNIEKEVLEESDNPNSKKKYSLTDIQNLNVNFHHPLTGRLIKIPVRGIRCEHPQCQDLRHVYEMGSSKQPRIICSFCNKQYSVYEPFQYDPLIAQKLKQFAQHTQSEAKMMDLCEKQSNSLPKQNEMVKQCQNPMVDQNEELEEQSLREQLLQNVGGKLQEEQLQSKEK